MLERVTRCSVSFRVFRGFDDRWKSSFAQPQGNPELATVGLPQAWGTQTSSFEASASSLSNVAEWLDRGSKYMLAGT
jgi:hypothetical protein